tara:strand:+ start:1011 stop:2105 length:1095 start_codon:yes stop_codon:yes gene_type:complete
MNVCLIGYNLTNFIIALGLTKKGFVVDILYENLSKKTKTNRTIGISKNNFEFLFSTLKQISNYSWPISKIKIFNQRNNSNESLNFSNENKKNFYLIKYKDLFNILEKAIKKSKKIRYKLAKSREIENLENKNKYDFIINSDNKNILTKKYFNKIIKKDYRSSAFTGILHHHKIKNNTAVQIFTKYGPLAFLPLSQTKTSIVYSVEKKYLLNHKDIKKIILEFNKIYRIKKLDELEKFDLNFCFSRNTLYKNIICFGDPTHKIHPLAGQGFNMTLRDIKILYKLIDEKISYGLEINQSLLVDYKNKTQHFNFIFATGINFINDFFILDNKLDSEVSKNLFKMFNKNKIFKKYSTFFADKGININY